jgi:ParB family chromosome partitioning protein
VTLTGEKLKKYFPKSYTPQQMEETIIKLLEGWSRKRQQSQER